MGCGVSSNSSNPMETRANLVATTPGAKISNSDLQSATIVASSNASKILIANHTTQAAVTKRVKQALLKQDFICHSLDENLPQSLSARANIIQWCDVFIVVVSRLYQRTYFCMEALQYAKDRQKPIISIFAESSFRPYGALGAISASAYLSIIINDGTDFEHVTSMIANGVSIRMAKTVHSIPKEPLQETDRRAALIMPQSAATVAVLIGTTDDGNDVAELLYEYLSETQSSVIIENLSKTSPTCNVAQCTVLVPILTPQFEQSTLCQKVLEQARFLNKSVVPVLAFQKWRPEGWLGLIIAGRVFFRIFDKDTAYKPFYDSNRITDLRVEIEVACQSKPSETEREEIEKNAIRKELDELKKKLKTWPPFRKSRAIDSMEPRQPVRIYLPEPHADSYFDHTHHSITRLTFRAPPAILDEYGLPKRTPLDCMLSYQWNKQDLVRQVYEDFHMRNMQTWFDIWGGMQGSTNDAMATGVECAKVLVVFLSKDYVASPNCQLEFRYAVQRGKAFVILRTEPNILLDEFMLRAIEGFPNYDVNSYEALEQHVNGVPLIDVIVQAVRLLAQAQPSDFVDDCSDELFELRCVLDDARDVFSIETGISRYKKCTRCGQQYDEYSKDGCKKHASYFLGGGGLLEDQWVCCRQQTADSPGCIPCQHIDQPRIFVEDPDYGSSTWQPA